MADVDESRASSGLANLLRRLDDDWLTASDQPPSPTTAASVR
jgi:hypothetical protein